MLAGSVLAEASGQNLSPCLLRLLEATCIALLWPLSSTCPICHFPVASLSSGVQLTVSSSSDRSSQKATCGRTHTGGEDNLLEKPHSPPEVTFAGSGIWDVGILGGHYLPVWSSEQKTETRLELSCPLCRLFQPLGNAQPFPDFGASGAWVVTIRILSRVCAQHARPYGAAGARGDPADRPPCLPTLVQKMLRKTLSGMFNEKRPIEETQVSVVTPSP